MDRLAIIYDDIFLSHDPGEHPDSPQRLRCITDTLSTAPFRHRLDWFRPHRATRDDLLRVHSREMIELARTTSESGGGPIDPDTMLSPGSYQAALASAGSGRTALDLITGGKYKKVFALTRPPGHHATSTRSMGFCIFNNIALCAREALDIRHFERVAVIDWDVHHGNGTEEIFYSDDRVLYASVHQVPLFPGTGYPQDTGYGRGKGFNFNYPLGPGAGGREYIEVFRDIKKVVLQFDPRLILVSAGFDGYNQEYLAGHSLNYQDYGKLSVMVDEMAQATSAGGRVIAFLEGGYNFQGLSRSVAEVIKNWLPASQEADNLIM